MFLLLPEGLLSKQHEFLAFPVAGQDGKMGVEERVQAPPRAVATAVRGRQSQEPGKEAGWQQGQQQEPGCWSSACGVSLSPPSHQSSP